MHGKKEAIARFANLFGLTRLMESVPQQPRLLVLTYHRIGHPSDTLYDPGNFSSTAEQFDWQVGYLRQHFDIVTLEQALALAEGRLALSRHSVLLTFDDGYKDNYLLAFPILRQHAVPATFFLPTHFIGTNHLPWWDEIAFILRNSSAPVITLPGSQRSFDLRPAHLRRSIHGVLELYKAPSTTDHEGFIAALEAICSCKRPTYDSDRCFLNWDEAREMQGQGMTFGSHTHTHPMLGKLTFDQQVEELRLSREILERELSCPIETIAYPVGQRDSFSTETLEAARATGYRLGFSFYHGINLPGSISPLNVLRTGVHSESQSSMRFLTSLQFFLPDSLSQSRTVERPPSSRLQETKTGTAGIK